MTRLAAAEVPAGDRLAVALVGQQLDVELAANRCSNQSFFGPRCGSGQLNDSAASAVIQITNGKQEGCWAESANSYYSMKVTKQYSPPVKRR